MSPELLSLIGTELFPRLAKAVWAKSIAPRI
jgi:hypothetical protein